MTFLDRPVTPAPGSWDTFGFQESVSFDDDSVHRSIRSDPSFEEKASRLLAANLLEGSFLQHHIHAHSQDSNQTEEQDCPIVHGIDQGDRHHGVLLP